ncbi:PREDICTED: mannose-6-phosphate isomerase [Polistes dominula]|uniref:Mannose-6-phosphate isomerase n=1 Tax=Polistes dominula TaxID=743375 RepID=A0ABM1IIN2_POLDO|nr:PREDICTED: mannose-6-phosphate isomerase [Polistes dominula]
MELICAVQNYDWGKYGRDSIVASLIKTSNPNFVINEEKPYAELWMGTHVNGPSYLMEKNISLEKYIEENTNVLGSEVEQIFQSSLPFLFKVLSVRKALSIQVHPDKKKAEELHLFDPTIYKDSNHKPELMIALTEFETLCGFRPIEEIKKYLELLPELRALIGDDLVHEFMITNDSEYREPLKKCFRSLMMCEHNLVIEQLKHLLERLSHLDISSQQLLNADLLRKLDSYFPGDIGCFGIYMFNYITLQPGEAVYIAPNEPHAYIYGDCIECMACSDNIVRAGLTPKLKDVKTLTEMLTYKCEPDFAKKFPGYCEDNCTEIFQPPVPDFAVAKILIPCDKMEYELIPRKSASIIIVINGKGKIRSSQIIQRGTILFVHANEKLLVKIVENCSLLMFQAFANV